jgi:hypothetical protein
MAATNYTPISLYYSTTAAATPSSGNLVNGELALNITDGKLFYKDNGGVVQVLGTKGGVGSSSNTQVLFNSSGLVTGASGLTWDGSFLTVASIKDSALTSGRITFAGASGLLSDASTLLWDGTYLTANSIKDSALTSGRITFAGASGLLSDASTLLWDGTYLTANSIKNSALTSGRVTFAGASGLLSDSANLTWNGSTFAITGNLTATTDSTFSSTGALTISKGTTAQRPTATAGMLRFNTTTTEFEGYNGTAWASVGGAALVNDTTTATDEYPLFASATTGTAATLYTSNAKYLYKPSTGELKVSAPVATNGLVVNADSVNADYTVATGTNAFSIGPITVASGISVTVASGQRWVII